jgi:hypothetical protein
MAKYKVLTYDKEGVLFCYFSTNSKKEAEDYMKIALDGVKHVLKVSE